jgi:hypothetical protein
LWTSSVRQSTPIWPVLVLEAPANIRIAVLVSKVVLRKRLDVMRLVAGRIPRLAAAIELQIRSLG